MLLAHQQFQIATRKPVLSARTIAGLAGSKSIHGQHIAEAIRIGAEQNFIIYRAMPFPCAVIMACGRL